jgi:hypothetical protein
MTRSFARPSGERPKDVEPIEGVDLETYVRLSLAHVRGAVPPERWDDVRRAWMERISTDEEVRDAYAELYRRVRVARDG